MLPWIVAGIAGVVLAALIVVYFVVQPDHTSGTSGQLTSEEQAAVSAAGPEAANLATYTRANFDKDYARALAGTTGALYKDVLARKSFTKNQLTTQKFDVFATVRHTALVGKTTAKTPTYVVLVVLFGYQSTNKNVPNPQNLQVTVERVSGKWLLSDVTAVTVS